MHDTEVLPTIEWKGWKIRDISRRFIIRWIQTKESKPYWFRHKIVGWKSIENVAYDFYGSCDYIWALMVANNIVHPINDWLKKEEEVIEDAKRKYGAMNLHAAHHYEYMGIKYTTKMKTLVDARNTKATYGSAIPQDVYQQVMKNHVNALNKVYIGDIEVVSNIDWEMHLNEKKRIVNIIYPELIPEIEAKMEKLF